MSIDPATKQAARELITRLYLMLDSENAEGFASYFAEGGTFVTPYGKFTGRSAVEKFMREHIGTGAEAGVRHYLTNFIVDGSDEDIRVRFYILKMRVDPVCELVRTASGECVVIKNRGDLQIEHYRLSIDEGLPQASS